MILVNLEDSSVGKLGIAFRRTSKASLISAILVLSRLLAVRRLYLLRGGGFDFGLGSFGLVRLVSVSMRLMMDVSRRLYCLEDLLGLLASVSLLFSPNASFCFSAFSIFEAMRELFRFFDLLSSVTGGAGAAPGSTGETIGVDSVSGVANVSLLSTSLATIVVCCFASNSSSMFNPPLTQSKSPPITSLGDAASAKSAQS